MNLVGNIAKQKSFLPHIGGAAQVNCGMTKSPPFPSYALAKDSDLEPCNKGEVPMHTALDCSKYSTSTSGNVVQWETCTHHQGTMIIHIPSGITTLHHLSSTLTPLLTNMAVVQKKGSPTAVVGGGNTLLDIPALPYEDEVVFSPITADVGYSHPSYYVKTNPRMLQRWVNSGAAKHLRHYGGGKMFTRHY